MSDDMVYNPPKEGMGALDQLVEGALEHMIVKQLAHLICEKLTGTTLKEQNPSS